MERMTLFKLWDRQRRDAPVRGLSCDEDGIFLGGDCPLVAPTMDATGRRVYRMRATAEVNRILSAAYGRHVDISDRVAGLRQAARYMTEGKWALAQVAAAQLRIPDLPDDEAVARLLKAEALLRFNPHHYPAGSSRGGQFAPGDQDGATTAAADSPADEIAHRKFGSDEHAARYALKHFYNASKQAGVEYAGVIYRDSHGTYGVTLPSTEKDGNDQKNSVIRWTDIPAGAQAVASYHTHLRTSDPVQDEKFSFADVYIARERRVRSYIATPSGRRKMYDGLTPSEADLGPL